MRVVLINLVSLFIFVFSSAQEASDCLSTHEVEVIKDNYGFNIDIDPSGTDLCDSDNYNYIVLRTLIFLKNLDLSGPEVPSPWNQNILPTDWLTYLKARASYILSVDYNPYFPEACRNNPKLGGFVIFGLKDGMYLCPALFEDSNSTISLVPLIDILLHEARHFDGEDGFQHVICESGLLKDRKVCDQSIDIKGSYAVSVEASSKLAVSATNIHPSLKSHSLAWAISLAETRFNQSDLKVSELGLAQEQ